MDGDKPIDFQAKKIEKQKRDSVNDIVICYIQGMDPDGERVFSYVAIPATALPEFSEAIQRGNVDVDEYGYRIVSGYGEPTDAVKKMMVDEYGFEAEGPIVPKPSNDE